MAGLPGTGKSTLARVLANDLGGVVLDKDVIRAALFPAALIEYSSCSR
jgi:predicted kinase